VSSLGSIALNQVYVKNMKAKIITTQSDFDLLKDQWNVLFEEVESDNVFISHAWLNTWWEFFGGNKQLNIVTVWDNEKLVGVAPLMIESNFGFKEMCFISSGYSDYEEFLLAGDESQRKDALCAIMESVNYGKQADILRVRQLRESSITYKALQDNLKESLNKHKEGAPYLDGIKEWEAYYSKLPKKMIKDTERQVSRLQKMGNLEFRNNVSEEEAGKLLKVLMDMHIARRAEAGGKSLFCEQVTKEFYRAITVKLFRQGVLRLSSLNLDGDIAAIHLGFQMKSRFYYYIPSFNDDFRPYSIGRILQIEIMKEAFNSGVKQFDFMLGEELYKMLWSPSIEPLYYCCMALNNGKGKVVSTIVNQIIIPLKRMLGKSW